MAPPEVPLKPPKLGNINVRTEQYPSNPGAPPPMSNRIDSGVPENSGNAYYSDKFVYTQHYSGGSDYEDAGQRSRSTTGNQSQPGGLSALFRSQFGEAGGSRGSNVNYHTERETTVVTRTTTQTVRGLSAMIFRP